MSERTGRPSGRPFRFDQQAISRPLAGSLVDALSDALTFTLGTIELGLIKHSDGQRAFDLRTEF